jgi:HTH-type transcriptional regulator/antitoxin HigA
MIMNKQQYEIARKYVEGFNARLDSYKEDLKKQEIDPILEQLYLDGFESKLKEIQSELKEYEDLTNDSNKKIAFERIKELGEALVKARIFLGLNQKDLANKIGVFEQQIQRYEQDNYSVAKLERVIQIANELGIKICFEFNKESGLIFNLADYFFGDKNADEIIESTNKAIQRKALVNW